MSSPLGRPLLPLTIEDHIIKLERRLNEAERRERGTGRGPWLEAKVLFTQADVLDNGFPSWRLLNDGRIELRGRLALRAPITTMTEVLLLPGICAPPGTVDQSKLSWVSTLAPCSSAGSDPGVIRVDVQRKLTQDPITLETLIHAVVIALPPQSQPLLNFIGFDHVTFDPNLYTDILDPVPQGQANTTYGHGIIREDGEYVLPPPWESGDPARPEHAIAFIGHEGQHVTTVVPGVALKGSNP